MKNWSSGKEIDIYLLGKDDGSVRFKMTFGANEKNTKGSPLSEKEALTAWDAILPTLKTRLKQMDYHF